MIKLIAVAAFALAFRNSAQAMSPAPLHQPDAMTTQVALGCGPFRTRVAGVCVARITKRHVRRQARRCARWGAGAFAFVVLNARTARRSHDKLRDIRIPVVTAGDFACRISGKLLIFEPQKPLSRSWSIERA